MACRFPVAALLFLPLTMWEVARAQDDRPRHEGLHFPSASEWETVDPESAGWDKAKLEDALDFAGESKSSGVVILHRGRILAERYWPMEKDRVSAAYFRFRTGETTDGRAIEDVASVQKSVASVLMGIAVERHLVKLSDPVHKYLGKGWSRAAAAQEDAIQVHHLVTMTTGLNARLRYTDEPGTVWKYNTGAYAKSMEVVEAASGMDRNAITKEWLTGPLGMEDSSWTQRSTILGDAAANSYGFSTTARDLARFGLLVQAGGTWRDELICKDREYFKAMLSPSQRLNPSYGYLWWLNGQSHAVRAGGGARRRGSLIPAAPRDLVAALGASDRKLYVVPGRDLVVTRLGDASGVRDFNEQFWKRLAEAAGDASRRSLDR